MAFTDGALADRAPAADAEDDGWVVDVEDVELEDVELDDVEMEEVELEEVELGDVDEVDELGELDDGALVLGVGAAGAGRNVVEGAAPGATQRLRSEDGALALNSVIVKVAASTQPLLPGAPGVFNGTTIGPATPSAPRWRWAMVGLSSPKTRAEYSSEEPSALGLSTIHAHAVLSFGGVS